MSNARIKEDKGVEAKYKFNNKNILSYAKIKKTNGTVGVENGFILLYS